MPVIQEVDPLSAASDAIGSYADRKRQNDVDAAAKQYQQQRDARKDMESDREFGLQQGEAADQHLVTQSQIKSAEQQRQIAAADEAFTRSMDGINRELAQAQLKGANMANAAAKYDVQIKAAQAAYAKDLAKAGLAEAQAQAHVAQVTSQNAGANAAADLAQKAAQTAQTRAQTGLTGVETSEAQRRLSTGADDYHPPASYAGGSKQQAAFDDAFSKLSPKGQEFYNMLYSANNPPTRAQAMMALAASRRGGGLSPTDYPALETMIGSRESQFVSPGQQAAAARSSARTEHQNEREQGRDREQAYRDVARGKAFSALPPEDKELIRSVLVDQGETIEQAVQTLPNAPIDPARKARIQAALTGS